MTSILNFMYSKKCVLIFYYLKYNLFYYIDYKYIHYKDVLNL